MIWIDIAKIIIDGHARLTPRDEEGGGKKEKKFEVHRIDLACEICVCKALVGRYWAVGNQLAAYTVV